MTVCRRYHELAANLPQTLKLAEDELGFRPPLVLVWSRPEMARAAFMRSLVAQGLVTQLRGRPPLPGEEDGQATTFPESHSIRMALTEAARLSEAPSPITFLTADVRPQPGTFAFIRDKLREGRAVVFHWENGSVRHDVWHTNFFCVPSDDPSFWPPLSPRGSQDVLERQWGAAIKGKEGVFCWHNSGNRRFLHAHQSESAPEWPTMALPACGGIGLSCTGWLPWHARLGRSLSWGARRGLSSLMGRILASVRSVVRPVWQSSPSAPRRASTWVAG
jgi:hypothetical protein